MNKTMNEFRKKRLELGLTQEEAAAILDWSISTISKWDAGIIKHPKREILNLELRYKALKDKEAENGKRN